MIEFTFPEDVIFAILAWLVINAIIIVFLMIWRFVDDLRDGTVRKKFSAASLRRVFKNDSESSKE